MRFAFYPGLRIGVKGSYNPEKNEVSTSISFFPFFGGRPSSSLSALSNFLLFFGSPSLSSSLEAFSSWSASSSSNTSRRSVIRSASSCPTLPTHRPSPARSTAIRSMGKSPWSAITPTRRVGKSSMTRKSPSEEPVSMVFCEEG